MKSCPVLWEAPNWSKIDWFEFQLLLFPLPTSSGSATNEQ